MLVISDTSVVCNLALIGRLDILKNLFVEVVIPEAVSKELGDLEDAEASALVAQAMEEGWLSTALLNECELELAASLPLHKGEAQAIAVAKLRHAELLCMDEQKGRTMAARLGLRLKGILGMLLDEKTAGRLVAVAPCIADLSEKAKFFMQEDLVKAVLRQAGE